MSRFVVIGGAGAMGRISVRDLVETGVAGDEIVIADFDEAKAKALAEQMTALKRAPKVTSAFCDVKKKETTVGLLRGANVVINCIQYQLNVAVMESALEAKVNYVDLGGLFHTTRKQMELDARFKSAGLTAVLGMGAAPGITNLLSRLCADDLDTVQEIHTRVASMDQTRYEPTPALAVSYSLQTILEEFSFEPAVFTKGEFKFVKPMSGDVPHQFPKPIGMRRPMYTIHSEVATLPLSYAKKGVKEVSFKIAFDPEFTDRVRFLRDLGLGSHDEITVGQGTRVRPIDVVNKIAMNQPPVKQVGKLKQYEVVRAIVKGAKKGKKVTLIADCHTSGMPEWGVGLDIDTGSPPAVAAQMIALGQVTEKGAIPAEIAIDPKIFFKHLKRRKMTVKTQKKPGWKFAT